MYQDGIIAAKVLALKLNRVAMKFMDHSDRDRNLQFVRQNFTNGEESHLTKLVLESN